MYIIFTDTSNDVLSMFCISFMTEHSHHYYHTDVRCEPRGLLEYEEFNYYRI
jgi:uncharacterized protein YqkB